MKEVKTKIILVFSFLVSLIISAEVFAIDGAASAPPAAPADFKVSFIPKPWEFNAERKYLRLENGWKFFKGAPRKVRSIDDAIGGIADPKSYKPRNGTEVPIGEKCEKPFSPECDDSTWITVTVPFNWFDLGREMDEFKGTTWYRSKFSLGADELEKGRATLHFGGVYYRAWVYVNGERAGLHEGGYTPFEIDVTSLLKTGENLLAVKVDNSIDDGDIQIGDWWNYGGIHREVYLEFTSAAYINDLTVKTKLTDDLSSAEIKFEAEATGGADDSVVFYIYRLEDDKKQLVGRVSAPAVASGKVRGTWSVSQPALWSPESPNLYFVKAVLYKGGLPVDGQGSIFGIRKFEVRGLDLFLNNRKVFFRGVNRHDEHYHGEFPDAGRVMTEEERISDFKAIKEMGGNAMRTAHYPNNQDNYYITDRLGIMTIEEGGAVGGPLNDDAHIEKIKNQMREMFERDKNHPSILIWSIGNEFGGDRFLKYIQKTAELMRSLDDRPLTFTETGERDVRKGYNYVDILSRNEYVGWYGTGLKPEETPENMRKFIRIGLNMLLSRYHGEYPGKPVFIMETGAESVCGRHAADPLNKVARGDEEYQELVLKYQFDELLDKKYVTGVFPWILADFKTRMAGGTCQFTPHLNRKGLQCADRTKKRAYFLVQKIYGELASKENGK